MQKPAPDLERVRRLMGRSFVVVGLQGLLQVGTVLLMAHLRLG